MAWRRDPATGEWEMIDPTVPDPMTQSTTGQEPNPALRDPAPLPPPGRGPSPDAGVLPGARYMPLPAAHMPSPTAEGATEYQDARVIPTADPDDPSGHYQNYDPSAYAAWEQAVEERGNEVRETAVGCFEVDSGGRIVSRAPSGYKVN